MSGKPKLTLIKLAHLQYQPSSRKGDASVQPQHSTWVSGEVEGSDTDVKQRAPSHDKGSTPAKATGGEALPPDVVTDQGQASPSNGCRAKGARA